MAQDYYGDKNQPQYSEAGAPQLATDLSQVSNYAATVGNRKIGTTAQRTALTGNDRWLGMAFWDTTLNFEFYWDGAAWAGQPVYISDASPDFTMASGWTVSNSQWVVCGAMISFRANVTKATSGITGTTSGNITNNLILTIDTVAYRPLNTIFCASDNTGYKCSFHLDADGKLYLAALPPGITMAVADAVSFSTTYLRAVA